MTACVLAGSLLGAATASASSTGFYIYNFTSAPMKLTKVDWTGNPDKTSSAPPPPKVGQVLMPGADRDHIEIAYVNDVSSVDLVYQQADGPPISLRLLDHKLIGAGGGPCDGVHPCQGGHLAQCSAPAAFQCVWDGSERVEFLDPPGTVRTVTGAEKQRQADVLQQLCTDRNLQSDLVTCDFEPTSERPEKTYGQTHLVGHVVPNCTSDDIDRRYVEEDETATESSFGIKFGIENQENAIFEKVKVSIETKYEQKWETKYTFKDEVVFHIKPGDIGKVVGKNPVLRYRGDFTFTIGNTTWLLPDVYFDSPDSANGAGNPVWAPKTETMTDAQKKEACADPNPAAIRRAPSRFASIKRDGTGRADVLFGGRESTTLRGLTGADIVLGGAGDDRLFGGHGRDAIFGGPGSDTIVDSRGRTRVSTGGGGRAGPDVVDVRDGVGDDTVICGSAKADVSADRRDRVRHCGN